jgi:hypothetical protein
MQAIQANKHCAAITASPKLAVVRRRRNCAFQQIGTTVDCRCASYLFIVGLFYYHFPLRFVINNGIITNLNIYVKLNNGVTVPVPLVWALLRYAFPFRSVRLLTNKLNMNL